MGVGFCPTEGACPRVAGLHRVLSSLWGQEPVAWEPVPVGLFTEEILSGDTLMPPQLPASCPTPKNSRAPAPSWVTPWLPVTGLRARSSLRLPEPWAGARVEPPEGRVSYPSLAC